MEQWLFEHHAQLDGVWIKVAKKASGIASVTHDDSSKSMVFPEDFLKALEENKQAQAFFNTLSKSNVYAIVWRLKTAMKLETRKPAF